MNLEQINKRRQKDQSKKINRVAYLQELIDESDWHGVADCAMDLREVEERLQMYDWMDGWMRDEQ